MGKIYTCKTVGEIKQSSAGTDYRFVETTCGKKFNVFEVGMEHLEPGIEFTCQLEQKGQYTNVVKDTFAVNMSTKKPVGTPSVKSDQMTKEDWAEKDRQKQADIAKMNALTNLTNLCVAGKLEDDAKLSADETRLVAELFNNAGLS